MKDSEFKALSHPVGQGVIATVGTEISSGYKPDITVESSAGETTFIIESEQKTDRKAFLGNFLKAEKYSEEQNISPELIIVMQESPNTTTRQIVKHLRPYVQWLASKNDGNLSISSIHVLSDEEYVDAMNAGEVLGSKEFKCRGYIV